MEHIWTVLILEEQKRGRCHYHVCIVHLSNKKELPRARPCRLTRADIQPKGRLQRTLLATIGVRDLRAKFGGPGCGPGLTLVGRETRPASWEMLVRLLRLGESTYSGSPGHAQLRLDP